ncbi:MAG: GNAT family N-acetyltransferase, partial [Caulobacteraceae bacterium]
GLVTAADERLDGDAILSGARLSAFRFTALIDPFGVFRSGAETRALGYRVVLEEGAESYAEKLTTASRNRHRNFRRYSHKLTREIGPLKLVAHRQSACFEELLDWKTAQIRRTGVQDFLAADWTRGLLGKLLIGEPPLEGLVLSLFAGERQVAAHFGVRSSGHFHPWIGASSPDLEAYSPGSVHHWMAIQAMTALKLRTYDLGPGFGHWKGFFANDFVTVAEGLASTSGASGRHARSRENLWRLPGLATNPLAARLRRRLDQIAQTELTLPGRLAGLLGAVASLEKRSASRKPALEERISRVLGEEGRP